MLAELRFRFQAFVRDPEEAEILLRQVREGLRELHIRSTVEAEWEEVEAET